MYSIPYPQSSSLPPIKAPYVSNCGYSVTGPYTFSSFVLHAVIVAPPRNLRASVIQSWLFFGLASEALGRDVDHEEFIEWSNGNGHTQRCIDIRIARWFWIELHRHWSHLKEQLSAKEFERRKKKLCKYCRTTLLTLVVFDTDLQKDEQENTPEDLKLVLLSIHMLLFVIADLLPSSKRLFLKSHDTFISTRMLHQRMIKNGWCRKRLNFFKSSKIYYPSLYFLSSITPPHGKNANHSQCTFTSCSVATTLLPPLHRTPECRCQRVTVPMREVIQILEDDGIPLVRIKWTGGFPTLEVVRYTRTTPFVAISHVWSDRQFGSDTNALPRCQLEYLDSILEKVPRNAKHWSLLDRYLRVASKESRIEPTFRVEWLFWLDTFCVPQDRRHAKVKAKAINMMNLIYGAADQTIVLDASLQDTDVGQRPASSWKLSKPTFMSPAKEQLLDTLALICASTWMGRAWTLQEGAVSPDCVFAFTGSLAYIRLLHILAASLYSNSEGFFTNMIKFLFVGERRKNLCSIRSDLDQKDHEPLAGATSQNLLDALKASLDIQALPDYPRGPASRAAKLVYAYTHLQSRTTTMSEDLPLILANLSSLNGNFISQIKGRDDRMRSVIYAIGSVPTELLFSNCKRFGNHELLVDGWIPCEVVPETISGNQFLQLDQKGFIFQSNEKQGPFGFFRLCAPYPRSAQFLLSCQDPENKRRTMYLVEALGDMPVGLPTPSDAGVCVLIHNDVEFDHVRGAQFLITRDEGNEVFLRYICPLRLWKRDDRKVDGPKVTNQEDAFQAQPAALRQTFILERSFLVETIGMSRPQNPELYTNRVDFVPFILGHLITRLLNIPLSAMLERFHVSKYKKFIICSLFSLPQPFLLEEAAHFICYRAWIATYQQSWKPNGPWKWFWKLMNFNSPLSMREFWKFGASLAFVLSLRLNFFLGMAGVIVYWLPLFEGEQLVSLCVTGLAFKIFNLL